MWRERQRSSSKSSEQTSPSVYSPPNFSTSKASSTEPTIFKTLAMMQTSKAPIRGFQFQLPPSLSSNSIGASSSADTNTSEVSKDDIDRAYRDISKFLGPIQTETNITERTPGVSTLNKQNEVLKQNEYEMLVNQFRGLSDRVDRCNNNSNKFVDVFKALTAKISRIEKEHKDQKEEFTKKMNELKEENDVLKSKLHEMEELIPVLWQISSGNT